MNKFKKIITLVSMSAMLCTSMGVLSAEEQPATDSGCAYDSCKKAPTVSPMFVLGVVAAAALITVMIQNRSQGQHYHADPI